MLFFNHLIKSIVLITNSLLLLLLFLRLFWYDLMRYVCLFWTESDIDRDSSRLRSNRHIGPDRQSRARLQLTRQRTASLERHVGESETTYCPMAQSKRPRRRKTNLKTRLDLSSSTSSPFSNSICFHSSLLILTFAYYIIALILQYRSYFFIHSSVTNLYIFNHYQIWYTKLCDLNSNYKRERK